MFKVGFYQGKQFVTFDTYATELAAERAMTTLEARGFEAEVLHEPEELDFDGSELSALNVGLNFAA